MVELESRIYESDARQLNPSSDFRVSSEWLNSGILRRNRGEWNPGRAESNRRDSSGSILVFNQFKEGSDVMTRKGFRGFD